MYMVKNNLTYDQLIEEKGVIEAGHVKELFWKPNFLVEVYYPGGEIHERYYINEQGKVHGPMIQFYKNGMKFVIVPYKNGIREGVCQFFYPGGQLKMEIIFTNDIDDVIRGYYINVQTKRKVVNGIEIWEVWNDNGEFIGERFVHSNNIGEIYYMDELGIKDGPYEETTNNERIYGFYSSGVISGYWQYWDSNDNLKEEGRYENFQKEGPWTEYGKDLINSGVYHNGNKDGVWQRWHINGQLVSEESYDNGSQSGLWKTFSEDGSLISEGYYENNNMEGIWKIRQSITNPVTMRRETLIFMGMYKENKREGKWQGFKDDKLRIEGDYQNGKREKEWKQFYDDGVVMAVSYYENGNLTGNEIVWYRDGQKKEEHHYINGQLNGIWRQWYENGQIDKEVQYINNMASGPWNTWYVNGQVKESGAYHEGYKKGIWNTWYENGQLQSVGEYHTVSDQYIDEDWKQGLWSEWDQNGNLSTGNYQNNRRIGVWRIYDINGNLINTHTY